MNRSAHTVLAMLALAGLLSVPAQAYEQQLTTEAIREAYFLGSRNDEITTEFWGRYERLFPASNAGLHVGAVEVLTPYAQVVLAAQHDMPNGNAVDAVQEYRHRSLPLMVLVSIYYPRGALPGNYDIEKQSSVVVWQGQSLKPRKTTYKSIRMPFNGKSGGGSAGVEVELQFETAQVSSGDISIRVSFTDGHHTESTFDLDHLK